MGLDWSHRYRRTIEALREKRGFALDLIVSLSVSACAGKAKISRARKLTRHIRQRAFWGRWEFL
jgi:hypothetical protein